MAFGSNNCIHYSGTGANQTFTVPKGVTALNATLKGSGGGDSTFDGVAGGAGGAATATIAVTPGEVLNVTVGTTGAVGTTAGYGGGGTATDGERGTGGSGGGMSALWTGAPFTGTPLLIAGGGGGSSGAGAPHPSGGTGGGASGGPGDSTSGSDFAGGGGTQTTGGTAAVISGTAGTKFHGGNGGGDGADTGGAGGGGWYGGGGGHTQVNEGDDNNDGGGGGGSGYIGGPGVSNGVLTAAAGSDAGTSGSVELQFTAPAPKITAPADGSTTSDTTPTISGTGVAGATVSVAVDGTDVICTQGTPVTIASNGTWVCTPTTPLSTGSKTLVATQHDPAQTLAVYPPSPTVTITIAMPAPVVTGPPNGSIINSGAANPAITGDHAVPGDIIHVDEAGKLICSTHVSPTGTWSCTPATLLAVGTHHLSIVEISTGGIASAPAALTIGVRAVDNLAITATSKPASIVVGATGTLTVTVTNNGPDTEPAAQVSVLLPSSLGYRSSTVTAGSYSSTTGKWVLGPVVSGQSKTLTITVAGLAAGSGSATFGVTGTVFDVSATNNTAVVAITVANAATTTTTATTTAPTSASASNGSTLPNTGYDLRGPLALSALLVIIGLVLSVGSRRRRSRPRH